MKLPLYSIKYFRHFKLYKNNLRCLSIRSRSKTKDSYYFKNGNIPLTNLTAGDALDKTADEQGDHIVYISHHQGISKTYSEFRNEAEKLASGLIACGLRRGDRVAIYSPNCYEWPLAQMAAAKAGLVAVTINFASQPQEVEQCLKKAGCKSVVSFEKLKHLDAYSIFNKIIPNLYNSNPLKLRIEKLPNLETVIMISEDNKDGMIRFKDVLNMGNKESAEILSKSQKLVECDDPVNIQFTSGTTGNPKAAVLTHHSLINVSNIIIQRLGFDIQSPIVCCQVPLFHVFGCLLGIFMAMMQKATIVLPCTTHDTLEILKSIEKYKCTTAIGTPTMYVDLLKMHKTLKRDINSLKQVVLGGSPILEGVFKNLFNDLKIPNIHFGYGLTETSAGLAVHGLKTNYDTLLDGFIEPINGCQVKIVDGRGYLVPKHTQGEICVKGYPMFSGYWEDKERTAEVIDEKGWFHTGDIGEMNDEGWIKIVGRVKDIVIRGGENIYVTEVENFLSNHPAVLEVHVCGVPDERLGEELCCWISVKPGMTLTEEDIRQFCRGKLSYYKIPRYFMFVEEFPKNTVGKVKKFEMTRISKEKLKL